MTLTSDQIALIALVGSAILTPILAFVSKILFCISNVRIIGVVSNAKEPEVFTPLRHYTSLFKAKAARGTVVLRCRTLSYALRHCDFVCANDGVDEKVIPPDSTLWVAVVKNEAF